MTYVSLRWILGEGRGAVWSEAERERRAIANPDGARGRLMCVARNEL